MCTGLVLGKHRGVGVTNGSERFANSDIAEYHILRRTLDASFNYNPYFLYEEFTIHELISVTSRRGGGASVALPVWGCGQKSPCQTCIPALF